MNISKSLIHSDITIEEFVEQYPEVVRILMEEGIPCIICSEPFWGTLRENAEKRGKNILEIIEKLNQCIK